MKLDILANRPKDALMASARGSTEEEGEQGGRGSGAAGRRPFQRMALSAYLAMVLALGWQRDSLRIGGMDAYPADLMFVLAFALWMGALIRGETRFRWHTDYWLIAAYFAAMLLSLAVSVDPATSAFKLATQLYLLALAVMGFNLVIGQDDIRRVALWWVAGAAAVSALGIATLLLFPLLGPERLAWPLHHFGTLSPGPYPRLELTFAFPAMLANYLSVAIMLVLIGRALGWFRSGLAWALGSAMFLTALFALTPGFGGLLFALGIWAWYREREARPRLAALALIASLAMPLATVLIAAVTPILHPTAPFLITVPALDVPLAPSVRLMAWMQAIDQVRSTPWLGHGIGVPAVSVIFVQPPLCSGVCITDAHNSFLNFAAQTGFLGLAAMLALIGGVVACLRQAVNRRPADPLQFGLCVAWLSGFVVQGLVGDFEDARHLWVALGLILAASRLRSDDVQTASARSPTKGFVARSWPKVLI